MGFVATRDSYSAFVGGVVGFVPVFALGLGVPIVVPGPLAFGTASLLAALAAGWVGNIAPLAPQQHTLSRLLAILAASGGGMVLTLLVSVAFSFAVFRLFAISDPYTGTYLVLATYGVCFVIQAAASSAETWRYRGPRGEGHLGFGRVVLLALSIVGLVVLLLLIPVMGSGGASAWPVIVGLDITLALTALGVASMARSSRQGLEGYELGYDAALTLALVGAWAALIIGAVSLTCLIVTCQP